MNKDILNYWEANSKFVEIEKKNPDVIAIITCGSLIKEELDKNSDIDIIVVLDSKCEYRERGNTWIDGIEIEYFKNPPQQIRSYLRKEVKSSHTANMLATGKLMYKNSLEIDDLILEAQEIIRKGPKEIKDSELQLAQYFLDDKFKDIADTFERNDDFGKTLLKFEILNLSIDTFCKVNRVWRAKDKKLKQQLLGINPDFAKLIELETTRDWTKKSIEILKFELTKFLGNQRGKEWNLRSSLDL